MNNRFKSFLLAAALPCMALAQQSDNYRSEVWSPDNGDGTYTNPVINADYSDPDVCVVGNDYYLTASSFQCIPGLPILHSTDLVNWEIIGYALNELTPYEEFNRPSHGNGVWAPSIRYHNGEFYIYWGDPDYGVFMVKTKNPAGPWEKPVCVIPGKGMIDTCPLWDEDGRCYLVNGWANSRSRFASVLCVRELNAEGTAPISNPVIVFDGNGTENRTCEGPSARKCSHRASRPSMVLTRGDGCTPQREKTGSCTSRIRSATAEWCICSRSTGATTGPSWESIRMATIAVILSSNIGSLNHWCPIE